MADDIVMQLTGDKGIAQTRVTFISQRSGAPELYISDYDGFNVRRLTRDGARKYSPNWSPDGTRIVYPSYRDGPHELFVLDLRSGKTSKIPSAGRTVLSPRWSPAPRDASDCEGRVGRGADLVAAVLPLRSVAAALRRVRPPDPPHATRRRAARGAAI